MPELKSEVADLSSDKLQLTLTTVYDAVIVRVIAREHKVLLTNVAQNDSTRTTSPPDGCHYLH